MAKKHYKVINVFPAGWIVNGKTLTEPVKMTSEELKKPRYIRLKTVLYMTFLEK